jgi:hypothetical protein
MGADLARRRRARPGRQPLAHALRDIEASRPVEGAAAIENVDAIRAVTASETDPAASIALTNDTLRVRRQLLAPLARAWRERSDDGQAVADAHF